MDVKCSIMVAVGAFAGNVIYVGYHFATIGYTSEEMPDVEIRVMCVLLTGVFMTLVCMAVEKVNREKLKQIAAQTDAARIMTEEVLETAGDMISGIGETAEKLGRLGESVNHISGFHGEH